MLLFYEPNEDENTGVARAIVTDAKKPLDQDKAFAAVEDVRSNRRHCSGSSLTGLGWCGRYQWPRLVWQCLRADEGKTSPSGVFVSWSDVIGRR